MDFVRFRLVSAPTGVWEHVFVTVNGRDLIDIVREIELPMAQRDGTPSIAGGYSAVHTTDLRDPPREHFLGSPTSHLDCGPDGMTVLLACADCGFAACWSLMARIETTADHVRWTQFEQPRRPSWQYGGLAFTFDRGQYDVALSEVDGRAPC